MTPEPSPRSRCGRSGMRNPGMRFPNGNVSSSDAEARTIFVEEMFTTAGNTLLTTGANVLGIVTGSLTGVAAATAAAGAWPASIAELPTKAPPAMDPMLSMTSAKTQRGYLAIRFMIFCPLDKVIWNTQKIRRTKFEIVSRSGKFHPDIRGEVEPETAT